MGWVLGGFGVFIALLLAAGAAVVICKRYSVGWQCGARDVWIICEEWRRKLSWLWAPREEKVGLVKAQHPTAQTVPGLYRQASTNSSQYILHSDSDLRLDAQGAFTRFEAVDRDLRPPSGQSPSSDQTHQQQQSPLSSSGASNIPPQPLRPAPQPRATARPRPSPLRPPTSVDYLRLRECEPSPLTPPPPPASGKFANQRIFLFQQQQQQQQQLLLHQQRQQQDSPSPPPLPPPPSASDALAMALAHADFGIRRSPPAMIFHEKSAGIGDLHRMALPGGLEETRKIRYSVQGAALSEQLFDASKGAEASDTSPPYGSYDIVHEAAGPGGFEAIYDVQDGYLQRGSSGRDLQDIERITRYIQSLPDAPEPPSPTAGFYDSADEGPASPATAPPPPAPSDRPADGPEPTTGEKIFKALRAVTSQSYIDASEFYNSILSSAQHVQSLAFASSSVVDEGLGSAQQQSQALSLRGRPSDVPPRRASDLYSPELNQEAQRTARQVYNSLQDPPASPLLVKDVDQQAYSYLSDPSFTRTSEDIFNSLEHRRKSVQERLSGFQEMLELESSEATRRRNSQELLSALEEVQLKRRLSQLFDECYQEGQHRDELEALANGGGLVSRRGSLGPEPEPPPGLQHGPAGSLDDLACLQRAISCESVCSDTSVVLNDLESGGEEAPVVGLVCVGLEYDRWPSHISETDLIVSVLEARDLIISDGRPAQNTFARVCLLPDRQTYVQTRLYKGTNSPSYQEKFYLPLDGGPVGRTLLVEVFSYELPNGECSGGESSLLGEANLRLGPAPRPPATTWLPLISPVFPVPQLGELMFSLSYLPTAERLTLVVVKARNLKGANETPGDFFVKVYLLQQGKKVHKKRTSIKRGEKSPIFNEAIIFSVSPHALPNIQLRLTVSEVSGDLSATSKAYSVGHVIVGATTSGRALAHWRQMLAALRRPVAMWHPLRK